jgi:hypothetical protein
LVLPTKKRENAKIYARASESCAACHTAFPELTPFGRRFKIGGYTLGGEFL